MARIRPAVDQDAEALVALRATVHPYLVRGVARVRRALVDPPPRERRRTWVAERDGELLGEVSAGLNTHTREPGAVHLLLHVHPEARRQGLGQALLATTAAHLDDIGARRVQVWATAEHLPFAQSHGYVPSREVRYSRLDLLDLPPVPAVPAGVVVRSLAELPIGEVYAADARVSLDEPGDMAADGLGYEDWLRDIWENPDLDRVASVAALVDGRIAAFTLVQTVGARAWSGMTGTVREQRGRGLAKLLKSVALRRAVDRGASAAFTANDEQNGPMLAVNGWLGYRPVGAQWSCLSTAR